MKSTIHHILIILIFTFSHNIFSQNSCKCPVENINDSYTIKVDSLETFKIINSYNESKNKICQFRALELEFLYYLRKKSEKALNLLRRIETIYQEVNCKDELRYNFYINKSKYYRSISNLEKLSEFSFLALAEAERLKDDQKQIESINHIVHLFTRMKESEKNWTYVKRAEALILKQKQAIVSVKNYRWLALVYEHEYTTTERKSLIDSTILFINKAKKYALKHDMTYELSWLYRALEGTSYHNGNPKQGLKYIDSAIYYAKQIKDRISIGPFYLAKAYDYWDLGQLKEAEKWTDTALYYSKYFDKKKDIGGESAMQVSASEIYEGIGKTSKALKSYKSYTKLKNSLLKRDRIEIVNELEIKYKTELKDAEIENLNQKQQIDALEIKDKQSQIKKLVVYLIIALSSIVLILFLGSRIQLKKTKQKNHELKLAFDKQVLLEKQITKVRDNIAQDFHDDLGNKLARLSFLSKMIYGDPSFTNEKVKLKVKQITNDANDLYTGTRDFIFSLKENSDCLDEVVTYLSDFGEGFFNKSGIKFILVKNIASNTTLPYYWSKQLVYIFKEAMTNALKHAKCNKVTLNFEYHDNKLCITCTDNGVGFTNKKKLTNGMLNMYKRAERIGGELRIVSEIEKGTTVKFIGKTT